MSEENKTFGPAKVRRKKAPVKQIPVSAELKAQYEQVIREHDERERTYGQYLHADNKGKR